MNEAYITECTQQSDSMVHYRLSTLSGGTVSGRLINWDRNSITVQFGPSVNHYEVQGRYLVKR